MTTDRLQQARDAAADTAFPDEGYRWAGRATPPPPPTPRRGQTFAPWREWTLEDSRHVINTPPAPKPRGVKRAITCTCQHCGATFERTPYVVRVKQPKYCSRHCYTESQKVQP